MDVNAAIDLKDWHTIIAVWEFRDRKWRLVKLTRLNQAIALCNHPKRLVFPPDINPNAIWKRSSKPKEKVERPGIFCC